MLNVQYEETLPVIAVKPEAPAQIEDKNTEPELLPTPQPSDELEKKSEEPKEKGGQPEEDAGYPQNPWIAIRITVNGEPVTLTGKMDYIFVDIFDFIDFDLADSRGRAIQWRLRGLYAAALQWR